MASHQQKTRGEDSCSRHQRPGKPWSNLTDNRGKSGVARQSDSPPDRLYSQNSGRQKHSSDFIAAARQTPECFWRPPKLLKSLSGGRRIDSVYAKTTLARGRTTLNNNNNNNKIPYSYCSWQGGMTFTFDEFEHFFQKKIYPSSRYDNPGKKEKFQASSCKILFAL
ncbi:hypothetical protein PoB_000960500 [Plakobranchus ocellatus]|uniref:Domain of unknown function with conserved HDNR motif domain-containing protein n=1 Tax=Plakobranchus ocellatus TaxID=259542 RepID=A0AAV3YK38_9GAST|nr:hypothetical protein PoB_000960500 [Plakobranchus ocellatus]